MADVVLHDAVLLLEDGTTFYGKSAGIIGTTIGELCFNTGMTGYQEIFTDPSYFGQMMVTTNVHIGNYGIKKSESESGRIQIAGLICRNYTPGFSRPQADTDIQSYFEQEQLVAMTGADTRAIVRHIRSKGAMNAILSSQTLDLEVLKAQLLDAPNMSGLELASKVTTDTVKVYGSSDNQTVIAALDFGIKQSIIDNFVKRNCKVYVFPARTTFAEMEQVIPDGYFLSNGPGDPAAMDYAINTVKEILAHNKPVFGICLGHQLLALAAGFPTYKMHNGHRGLNHPVKNLVTGLCEITSQNHGFCVVPEALKARPDQVEITHINLNDQTIEGIRLVSKPAFSVQYHPEASPGPHDARYLFDQFVTMINSVVVESHGS
jgi:carbamoyl-phosphate synthase small subunit